VPTDSAAERGGVVSFVGSVDRAGAWSVPRHLRVVAVMGSATIDFRQAHTAAGVSEVEIFALMGNVTLIVPPELAVECDVDPLIGSVDSEASSAAPSSDAPRIRVSGSAVLSSIEIEVREPGDDDPFRRRRRAAQRVLESNPTPPGRPRR